MYSLTVISHTAEDTHNLGQRMGKIISPPFSIALIGNLGAGKTCFAQGLARGLGVNDNYYINSPTYGILNEYPARDGLFWHLDLYRLGSPDELDFLGIDTWLDQKVVMAVEWPDFLLEDNFPFDLTMGFTCDDKDRKIICLSGTGQTGENLLENLSSILS